MSESNVPTSEATESAPRVLYDADYKPRVKSHEESVRARLGWIVAFTGIVAGIMLANLIINIVISAS